MKHRIWISCLLLLLVGSLAGAANLPAGFDAHLQAYREYVRTLWFLTGKADRLDDQSSPEYLELSAQGHFFQVRVSAEFQLLKKQIKDAPEASMARFRAMIAKDRDGQEFALIKKLFGYNLRVLKAKDPSLNVEEYLPQRRGPRPGSAPNNLFLSLEDRQDPTVPAPTSPSAWAMQEFDRFFAEQGQPAPGLTPAPAPNGHPRR